MQQRPFDTPDQNWLTEQQLAEFLGIGLDLLRERVKKGVIPPPKQWTRETKLWNWRVASWVYLGLELGLIDPNTGPFREDTAE